MEVHSTTFKENQIQPISKHTSHQLWNTVVEVVMIWASYSQWIDCELLCIPKFYRVQCDVLKLLLLKFCPFIFIKCKLKSVLMLKDWIFLLPLKACTALHMQMNLYYPANLFTWLTWELSWAQDTESQRSLSTGLEMWPAHSMSQTHLWGSSCKGQRWRGLCLSQYVTCGLELWAQLHPGGHQRD